MYLAFTQVESNAVSTALNSTIQKLKEQLQATKEIANNVIWIKFPFKADNKRINLNLGTATGVYKIIHIPTGKVMYVGQGTALKRRYNHKAIFLNNGEPKVYKDANGNVTSSNDSPAGRKMFAFDNNIENWEFHVCTAPKHIAQQIEEQLHKLYEPEFCDPKMSGVC
jgi:hypothetical protein